MVKRKSKKKRYSPIGRKSRRSQMQETNRQARKFLFAEGWDWIWFKSHVDARKRGDYYYLALDQKAIMCLDPYNLFDACAYDPNGIFWWIQIKTDNWPDEVPIKAFMVGKKNVGILAINVKTPTKTRLTYSIAVKEGTN